MLLEIWIILNSYLALKKRLNEICAHHTGHDLKRIEKDTDRDHFMSAEEAKHYGIVDEVINKRISK